MFVCSYRISTCKFPQYWITPSKKPSYFFSILCLNCHLSTNCVLLNKEALLEWRECLLQGLSMIIRRLTIVLSVLENMPFSMLFTCKIKTQPIAFWKFQIHSNLWLLQQQCNMWANIAWYLRLNHCQLF